METRRKLNKGESKMAGICLANPITVSYPVTRFGRIQCCSVGVDSRNGRNNYKKSDKTPQLLKQAVTATTELLKLFNDRGERVSSKGIEDVSISGVEDVIEILKSDYENAYFVTGVFTSGIYADDCIFEDPTIRFQGTELYSRNLKLLVPFFDCPSIGLQNIERSADSETVFVKATWKLRTYLKFPWRPFISIDGSTIYELDDNDKFKIVRHAESWSISALEAIGQIFTPSSGKPSD